MKRVGAKPLAAVATLDRRPRILLVGPFPPTKGGVTTFMLNLIASPASVQFEFVPFTTSRPPKRNVTKNWGYGAVFRGGPRRVIAGLLITVWHLALFPFAVVSRSIDIVQIQASDYQVFWEAALYAVMARVLGRPTMFRIGGSFDIFHRESPPFIRRLIATVLRIPDCVVVQSRFARDYVEKIGGARDLCVLPNWSRNGAGAPRVSSKTISSPLVLFIAGSEAEHKGVREMLEAAKLLALQNSSARFHLIAVPERLAVEIRGMRLDNIAAIEGPLDYERVLNTMENADIFLLPSHGEGFPNSLIEAMAAGMASVVTPVGAVPEIVATGGALTVSIESPAELAAAVARLTNDRELRQTLGEEAQHIVAAHYTSERVILPLMEKYRALMRAK